MQRRPVTFAVTLLFGLTVTSCAPGEAAGPGRVAAVATPAFGRTTESGGSATFSVFLRWKPNAEVIVGVASSRPSEGTVTPSTLTFTPTNWNAPQTITVRGVDDQVQDGDQTYTIEFVPLASADRSYDGYVIRPVTLMNLDDESAGLDVTPTSGLLTTERGGTATFSVQLRSAPTADVTIPLYSDNPGEGTVDPAELVFTPVNWSAPQIVTVRGVDDPVKDGDSSYRILAMPALSTDPRYAGLVAAEVACTNLDDETPGVSLTPTSGLTTTEAGGTAQFTVVLTSQPTANVTIPVVSSNTREGTVSPSVLTFTPVNWNAPQTVTVTGVDDLVADGNQPYTVDLGPAASADANYAALRPPSVSVTNLDDETPGVRVTPTSGLTTTEARGAAQFTVVLTSQPTANVTFPVVSSNTREGTVSPSVLTFTPVNWNAPQTVTVTGVDDLVADGNQPYTVDLGPAASDAANYAALRPPSVSVTNLDDETPGVRVTPTSGLTTTEAGGAAQFTVVLTSQPTANVTLPVVSSNTREGTVSPSVLTFTPVNWNAPQTVTVTGVDDLVADGNQPYTVDLGPAASDDANYNAAKPSDVAVVNVDDDTAGITVSPTSGLVTSESGKKATFTIHLNSQPTADVVIGLSSSNVNEGNVAPAQVTFTPTNWMTSQTVTITGVDDLVPDGNQPYTIVTAPAQSADPRYNLLDAAEVSVTNVDNDTAGILVTPVSGLQTTEAGGQATFTIALASRPEAPVTIGLSSSNVGEVQVTVPNVTFTPDDWSTPQIITVTGLDDFVADGNQPFTIATAPAVSADPAYAGLDAPDVTGINVDNDTVGITVAPASLRISATVRVGTFTIVLTSRPTADVTVPLTSSSPAEGTPSPASVTFTSATWSTPQTVTVTTVEGSPLNKQYKIVTAPASSADLKYAGFDAADVTVMNVK